MDDASKKILSLGVFMSIFSLAAFTYTAYISPLILQTFESGNLYGISVEMWLGIISAMGPLAIILGTHVMGSFSDELGRRKIAIAGIIISIAAMVCYIFAQEPALLMLGRALSALGFTSVSIIALAKVNDLTKDSHRGRSQGFFLSIVYVGSVLGPLAGVYLTSKYSLEAPFIAALVVFVALTIYLLSQKKGKFKPQHKGSFSMFENWRSFLGFRKLKGMAILGVTMHAHAPLVMFFLPLFVLQKFPGRLDYVGYAALCVMAFRPLQFIAGSLVDKFGRAKLTIIGCLIVGMSLFLIPLSTSIGSLLGTLLFFSAGGALWNVGAWTVMSSIGEANHIEGHIVGGYASIAKVGHFFASLVYGVLLTRMDITQLYPIGGYIVMGGILLSLIFLRDITPSRG